MKIAISYRGTNNRGWATGDCLVRAAQILGHQPIPLGKYYRSEWFPTNWIIEDVEPDLLIYMECNDDDPQYDFSHLRCPKVFWDFDTSMHEKFSEELIKKLKPEIVYMANKKLAKKYNATYLPYAIDPFLMCPRSCEKSGAAIIGHPFKERVEFANAVGVPIIHGVYADKYAHAVNSLNVHVHNYASGGDGLIVCRIWETMSVMTCLLAEYDETLFEHFKDGVHLLTYKGIDDCKNKLDLLSKDIELRDSISVAGYECVMREHKYTDRLNQIIKDVMS